MLRVHYKAVRFWNSVVNNKYNYRETIEKHRLTKEEQRCFIKLGRHTIIFFANVFISICYKSIADHLQKDVCKDEYKIEGSHDLDLVTKTEHLTVLSGLRFFNLFKPFARILWIDNRVPLSE